MVKISRTTASLSAQLILLVFLLSTGCSPSENSVFSKNNLTKEGDSGTANNKADIHPQLASEVAAELKVADTRAIAKDTTADSELAVVSLAEHPTGDTSQITVYKNPSCSCCDEWISYLQNEGFKVSSHDHENMSEIKIALGLHDPTLTSCHTAVIDGYVVEGHVPVSDIRKMLGDRPEIVGLTAPGMPSMSPGMNSLEPIGYDVLSFKANGDNEVYSSY